MKLYYSNGACSLTVRITFHEMGIPCEYEAVNLKTKVTESGANYLEINPKGSVPVLLLDTNEVLTENAVILQYLADTHPETGLLASIGNMNRYRTLEWLNLIASELHRYTGSLFGSRFSEEVKQTVFMPLLSSKLAIVDKRLSNHKFLMGEKVTLCDSYMFVILTWLVRMKIDITTWPNLVRYFMDMKSRPAVQQALQEEGLTDAVSVS
jgi:glutathione S-transferase